ncbi:cation channel sperm-associated protein 4 [Dromaius novaehollandiae]|uniref:cation channel sperm-associated protein 4 n=1 Tax=Dromaius novaehollandiae TaxID=8790 RepID=UPI00311EA1AB
MPGSAEMASPSKTRRRNQDAESQGLLINYRDVVCGEDLWDHEEYLAKVCTSRFLAHPAFKFTVAGLVLANVAVIASQAIPRFKGLDLGSLPYTDFILCSPRQPHERGAHLVPSLAGERPAATLLPLPGRDRGPGDALQRLSPSSLQIYFSLSTAIDNIVLTVLFFEVLLNWYKGFWLYWKDGWNIFNFFIVVYLSISPLIPPLNDPKILQILRVMRLLQVCMLVKGLARMIRVIFKAIPNLLNIMFLLFILMLVFSMLGVILFSNIIPAHFGNLGKALYSLFVCVTQDGWLNIYQAFEKEGHAVKIGGAIYLLVFLTGGTFICANLLVAVVMSSLEESLITHEKKQQKKEQGASLAAQPCLELVSEDVDMDPELGLTHFKAVMWDKAPMHNLQEPFTYHNLANLSKEAFNDFCLLLHSIRENLRHYKEIREELNTIVEEVRSIEFNQAQEQELILRNLVNSSDNSHSSDR